MAIKSEGSQTAVISTEHTLLDTTDSGSYVLSVNTLNMAISDTLILRVYKKVKSTGTLQLMYQRIYANNQAEMVKESIPVRSESQFKVTLEQTTGTGRIYDWEVDSL